MDLYLDSETERILKQEAGRFELSSSAFVRVLAVIWHEDIFHLTISELREHVQEILDREERRI